MLNLKCPSCEDSKHYLHYLASVTFPSKHNWIRKCAVCEHHF